jgi:uncharacterized protein (DUF697 family)
MTDASIPSQIDAATAATLDSLAARFSAADGVGMQVLTLLGGQAEGLIERLPAPVRRGLDGATRQALEIASRAALVSRRRATGGADWLTTAATTAMGAAGGFGGLPTALAELPVTTTVLLRAIQGIAAEHGFDLDDPTVRAQCLQVFAAAGPLADDDGADVAFLATRISLSGPAIHAIIARVAPRLSVVLGQKLAAQTVPLIGAVAGAATNYAFTTYYQEMAHVYFGLRRLSRDGAVDLDTLMSEFRLRVAPPRAVPA